MANVWPTDSDASEEWIAAYLDVLGVERAAPSLPALAEIVRAQLRQIAFENVTSILRRAATPEGPVPPPDPDALLHNWKAGSGGGVCFELAAMLNRLLRGLGYRSHLVLGQISIPDGHHAIVVELEGDRYLVDVGSGSPLFEPIPLDRRFEVRRAGLTYRFRPADDDPSVWLQERWIDNAWAVHCRYIVRPANTEDREASYQRHLTPGASWVTQPPRIVTMGDDELYRLNGESFSHFTSDGKHTDQACTPDDIARLTSGVLNLPRIPFAEATIAQAKMTANID